MRKSRCDGLSTIIAVESTEINRSIDFKKKRHTEFLVTQTCPVKVCIRVGTLVAQPDNIASSPPFGDIEYTIENPDRLMYIDNSTNDLKS